MNRGSLVRGVALGLLLLGGLVACGSSDGGSPVSGASYLGSCRQSDKDAACMDYYVEKNNMGLSQGDLEDAVKDACVDATHTYNKTKCDATPFSGSCKYDLPSYYYLVFSAGMSETTCKASSGQWTAAGTPSTDGDAETSPTVDGDSNTSSDGPKGSVVGSCVYATYFCAEYYSSGYTATTATSACTILSATFSSSACERAKYLGGCVQSGDAEVIWYRSDMGATAEQLKSTCTSGAWLKP